MGVDNNPSILTHLKFINGCTSIGVTKKDQINIRTFWNGQMIIFNNYVLACHFCMNIWTKIKAWLRTPGCYDFCFRKLSTTQIDLFFPRRIVEGFKTDPGANID